MQDILRASLRRIDLKYSHDQRITAVEKGASASEQRALVRLVKQHSVLEATGIESSPKVGPYFSPVIQWCCRIAFAT